MNHDDVNKITIRLLSVCPSFRVSAACFFIKVMCLCLHLLCLDVFSSFVQSCLHPCFIIELLL